MMDELVDDIAEYNNSANAIGFSVYYYISQMYLEARSAAACRGRRDLQPHHRRPELPAVQRILCRHPAGFRRRQPGAQGLRLALSTDAGRACVEQSDYVAVNKFPYSLFTFV